MNTQNRIRAFHVVYTFLTLNFLLPAISYITHPELAHKTMDDVNRLLGGGAWPDVSGQDHLWHMLAVGNVMTLAVMCALLLVDLRRFYRTLGPLAFLKGWSALYSLVLGFTSDLPAFFAVFVLDGVTVLAMVFFARRAKAALDELDKKDPGCRAGLPLWSRALLLRPRLVEARLSRIENAPSPYQVSLGCLRQVHRLLFRAQTVGTSVDPVRSTWRARFFKPRGVRLPFLLLERAVAPFDMSGLASPVERIIRHLLAAHHEGDQLVYDLEILLKEPGAVAALEVRAAAIVEDRDPRAAYLKDLCVFEGYHERLLKKVRAARRGELPSSTNPDITLDAFLSWCRVQSAPAA